MGTGDRDACHGSSYLRWVFPKERRWAVKPVNTGGSRRGLESGKVLRIYLMGFERMVKSDSREMSSGDPKCTKNMKIDWWSHGCSSCDKGMGFGSECHKCFVGFGCVVSYVYPWCRSVVDLVWHSRLDIL